MRLQRAIALGIWAACLMVQNGFAQNRIAVVTDSSSGILPEGEMLSGLLSQTYNRYDFLEYVPDPLDVHEYSCLILTSRNATIACNAENIDRYIRAGGGFICGGGIPYYLVQTDSIVPISDWFDCSAYVNGSGKMYASITASEFGLSPNMLIDNTACGVGYGGLQGAGGNANVLAYWTCNDQVVALSALTNTYGSGRATYISRMTSSEPLRQLFVTSLGKSLEYVWGDANHSGYVDIDDVVFLVEYIFKEGSPPDIWNAADPSGDGQLDIDDVVAVVGWVFLGEQKLRAGRID